MQSSRCSLSSQFTCQVEAVKRAADGSSLVTFAGTTLLCTVNGPTEVKYSQELIDRATVEVTISPTGRPSDPRERELCLFLRRIAERTIVTSMHPRSLISIQMQEISSDCPLNRLPAMVNAMCVALVNASVPLTMLFSCAMVMDEEGKNAFYSVCTSDGAVVCTYGRGNFSQQFLCSSNSSGKGLPAAVGKDSELSREHALLIKSIKEKLINFYQ